MNNPPRFGCLKPGCIQSIAEIMFDPHIQTPATVTRLAEEPGVWERACFGNRISFVLNFEKKPANT